jgi:hypothetical protein
MPGVSFVATVTSVQDTKRPLYYGAYTIKPFTIIINCKLVRFVTYSYLQNTR